MQVAAGGLASSIQSRHRAAEPTRPAATGLIVKTTRALISPHWAAAGVCPEWILLVALIEVRAEVNIDQLTIEQHLSTVIVAGPHDGRRAVDEPSHHHTE